MVDVDVAVVGAGAAGTFAALGARGTLGGDGATVPAAPDAPSVLLLDGQARPGRKVLVSGGGRCNVTNVQVRPSDVTTSAPRVVRQVLRALPPEAVRRFLDDHGVPTHVEPLGKVFPVPPLRARDVLAAIDGAVADAGVARRDGAAVTDVARADGGWRLVLGDGPAVHARRVVVATGGRSVPATGSTGFGLDLAEQLGVPVVPTHPHLAALHGTPSLLRGLEGLTLAAVVRVVGADGRELARAAGSLLVTHRGVSGPAALDVAGAVEAAHAAGTPVRVLADLWSIAGADGPLAAHVDEGGGLPGACLPDPPAAAAAGEVDVDLRTVADGSPRAGGHALLAQRLPRRVAAALAHDVDVPLGQLSRDGRRRVAARVAALELGVVGTAGYPKAEVTTGGVDLRALDRRTLAGPGPDGPHWCGEVCDATGRLGGFNFAWAWASGLVAGRGAAAALT